MTLTSQLDTLESSGLISQAETLPEIEYLFRHVLIQDAASASLLRADRRNLHRLVGEALEPLFAGRPTELAPLLALHFAEAGDDARALHYYELAGEAAASRYANAEAATYFGAAIALAQHTTNAQPAQLQALYLRRGRALELSARDREALANYEDLERLGRERHEPAFELAGLMARATIFASARDMREPPLVQLLSDRALALARSLDDRAAEAKILWNLMHNARDQIQFQTAAEYGEQSLAIARALGLREQIAFTLNDLTLTYMVMSRFDEAQVARQEAMALWREFNNLPMLSENLVYAGIQHVLWGEYDEALSASRDALRIAQQIDNTWGRAMSQIPLSMVLLERGEIDDAVQAMHAGVRLGEAAGLAPPQVQLLSDLSRVCGVMGDDGQGIAFGKLALHKSEVFPTYRLYALGALATVHLRAGRIGEAAALVEAGFPELGSPDVFPLSRFALIIAAIELALAQADFARAAFFSEMGLAPAQEHKARYYFPVLLGLRARALFGMGQLDEAWQQAQEALGEAQALAARWSELPILELCGDISEARENAEQARRWRAQAADVAGYLADHAVVSGLRDSFLNLPHFRKLQ